MKRQKNNEMKVNLDTVYMLYSSAWLESIYGIRGGYIDKVLYRYFGVERVNFDADDSAVVGWKRSLEQMDIDADVVFFCDSLTSAHDWQEEFPDVRVINLGIPGNALLDMYNRIDMVAGVKPEKIFIMGGVNGIRNGVTGVYLERYALILDELMERVPGVQIYVQSVLPVSKSKEGSVCRNSTIEVFNGELKTIALERGATYIDLYSLYVLNGYINPELTKDGLHLQDNAYGIWVDAVSKYIR